MYFLFSELVIFSSNQIISILDVTIERAGAEVMADARRGAWVAARTGLFFSKFLI